MSSNDRPEKQSWASLFGGNQNPPRRASTQSIAPAPTPAIAVAPAVEKLRTSVIQPTISVQNLAAFRKLEVLMRRMPPAEALRFVFGYIHPYAPEIANYINAQTVDTEHFSHNKKVTELGLAYVGGTRMRQLLHTGNGVGDHAEHLLKAIEYSHFRVRENAHFLNRGFPKGDPTGYLFGETRTVTEAELVDVLNRAFYISIDKDRPELGYCPIILIGHAIKNDVLVLERYLGWRLPATIVRIVDTQDLLLELDSRAHQINLAGLMSLCHIPFRNPHTAGNDAAYCVIAGVLIDIRYIVYHPYGLIVDQHYPGQRTIQQVVEEVRLDSIRKAEAVPESNKPGIKHYCDRCGSTDHSARNQCKVPLHCRKCYLAGGTRRDIANTHLPQYCSWVPSTKDESSSESSGANQRNLGGAASRLTTGPSGQDGHNETFGGNGGRRNGNDSNSGLGRRGSNGRSYGGFSTSTKSWWKG
jgi:hypothetical protein